MQDLARPGLRFVNRQRGSGTRILFDALLSLNAIDATRIQGGETSEFTHAAVAAFVASGMADVGFGVEPAARQFKLDFIPVVKERYMLACRARTLRQAAVQELLLLLKGDEFRKLIGQVPGYEADSPGELSSLKQVFS